MKISYEEIVARRKALRIDGYKTLSDIGFDGEWVTPYQKTSRSMEGPVLVALHWIGSDSIAKANHAALHEYGCLPEICFNKVLSCALEQRRLTRGDVYMTQAFHLIPPGMSEQVPAKHIRRSFEEVTRHELVGRAVIALGRAAAQACSEAGVTFVECCHPSRRGHGNEANAAEIAAALARAGF